MSLSDNESPSDTLKVQFTKLMQSMTESTFAWRRRTSVKPAQRRSATQDGNDFRSVAIGAVRAPLSSRIQTAATSTRVKNIARDGPSYGAVCLQVCRALN
jgi:hypothetical protein